MIRRPPRSTLFPTRRSSDLAVGVTVIAVAAGDSTAVAGTLAIVVTVAACVLAVRGEFQRVCAQRSEEHTSELQSRRDLVCRLLLEKKKKTKQTTNKRSTKQR